MRVAEENKKSDADPWPDCFFYSRGRYITIYTFFSFIRSKETVVSLLVLLCLPVSYSLLFRPAQNLPIVVARVEAVILPQQTWRPEEKDCWIERFSAQQRVCSLDNNTEHYLASESTLVVIWGSETKEQLRETMLVL